MYHASERIIDLTEMPRVTELIIYLSPLLGASWDADERHPPIGDYLSGLHTRRTPIRPARRTGPRALSRAWCLVELAEAMKCGHRIHVEVSSDDRDTINTALADHFEALAEALTGLDAASAQVRAAAAAAAASSAQMPTCRPRMPRR